MADNEERIKSLYFFCGFKDYMALMSLKETVSHVNVN